MKEIKDIVAPYTQYNPDTGRHDIINGMPLEVFYEILINLTVDKPIVKDEE